VRCVGQQGFHLGFVALQIWWMGRNRWSGSVREPSGIMKRYLLVCARDKDRGLAAAEEASDTHFDIGLDESTVCNSRSRNDKSLDSSWDCMNWLWILRIL